MKAVIIDLEEEEEEVREEQSRGRRGVSGLLIVYM